MYLTHKGWLFFCPVFLEDPDGTAPFVTARGRSWLWRIWFGAMVILALSTTLVLGGFFRLLRFLFFMRPQQPEFINIKVMYFTRKLAKPVFFNVDLSDYE